MVVDGFLFILLILLELFADALGNASFAAFSLDFLKEFLLEGLLHDVSDGGFFLEGER